MTVSSVSLSGSNCLQTGDPGRHACVRYREGWHAIKVFQNYRGESGILSIPIQPNQPMATQIFTDGTCAPLQLVKGPSDLLRQLQEVVGGYLEIISLPNGQRVIVNEDAITLGLPTNQRGTLLAMTGLAMGDEIKGVMVLCEAGELEAADAGEIDG